MGKGKEEKPGPVAVKIIGDGPKEGLDFGVSGKWSMRLALFLAAVAAVALFVTLYEPPARDSYGHAAWAGWSVIGYAAMSAVLVFLAAGLLYGVFRLWILSREILQSFERGRAIDRLELERKQVQNGHDAVRGEIEASYLANFTGRMGALVKPVAGGMQVLNLDAEKRSVFLRADGGVEPLNDDPFSRAQIAALHQLEAERARASQYPDLQTYHHQHEIKGAPGPELAAADRPLPWPVRVPLRDLLSDPPSLHRLALGVTVDPETHIVKPLHADLSQMVHIAVGGSSGWGKSVFLRSLAIQMATAAEFCQLALIDLEGVTFPRLAHADRLLWPIAESEVDALAIMGELLEEMNRRKSLYAEYPGVDNLLAYNSRSREPLPPVVCLIDEATALLSDRSIHGTTRTLALRARKYGIWLVLGGQDWKASSVDSAIRNQLSTKMHFKADNAEQSRTLLGDGVAKDLDVIGRAYALLPGQPLTEIQAPWVTDDEAVRALEGQSGPIYDAPSFEDESSQQAERIRELATQGLSLSAIQRELFGYTGGAAYEAVKAALSSTTTTDAPESRNTGGFRVIE